MSSQPDFSSAIAHPLALVTGGAGFIGYHLCIALLERGYQVRIIDNFVHGQRDLVEVLARHGGRRFEVIEASILDEPALKTAMRGVKIVFHEAALAGVPQSLEQPLEYHETDATGTLRVLQAAHAAGARRLIYAGSSSAYGDQPELPKRESMRPMPISPYGVAKHTGELYLRVYAAIYGMQTLSLRYFNVFGPHQDPKSQYGAAVPAIVSKVAREQRPTIYGDGEQTRDFCYVQNVARANLLAAEMPRPLTGQVVNIACAQRISINEILRLANRMLGKNVQAIYAPPRPGDVRDSWADISEAKALLNYQPEVYFEQGLKKWIEWHVSTLAETGG